MEYLRPPRDPLCLVGGPSGMRTGEEPVYFSIPKRQKTVEKSTGMAISIRKVVVSGAVGLTRDWSVVYNKVLIAALLLL